MAQGRPADQAPGAPLIDLSPDAVAAIGFAAVVAQMLWYAPPRGMDPDPHNEHTEEAMPQVDGLNRIGALAMEFIEELEDQLPEGTEVGAVGICVELTRECDDCGEVNEFVAAVTDTGSRIYAKALFAEAVDSVDAQYAIGVGLDHGEGDEEG